MITNKMLIYTVLASTLLGVATVYSLLSYNLIPRKERIYQAVTTKTNQNSLRTITRDLDSTEVTNVQNESQNGNAAPLQANTEPAADYQISSQKGYDLIKPMLWAKPVRESEIFAPLKAEISGLIEQDKQQHLLTSASVYLYSFSDGAWTYINPGEFYHPGSIIKVTLLISYLKEAEKNPGLLDKKILCENSGFIPTQTYETNSINPGHTYTIKELLHYMIAYSDNNATALLNRNMNETIFKKTFTDLNIPEPNLNDADYQITAKTYSRFFMVLYNATYLSRTSSEYALKLLTTCDFKNGLVKGLPGTVPVAHKFGEWGNKKMGREELHESGIIYLQNRHYLLTVMTRGNNPKDLSEEISRISRLVYNALSNATNI